MKVIPNMGIGESFYLKKTVVAISTRTGTPCEFDEERIDINDLIIAELEKLKAEIEEHGNKANVNKNEYELAISQTCDYISIIIDNHIKELKGEQE